MDLQFSTWPQVETYLKSQTGIIIPVGSTEQHGPNGFIGTDALCPQTIAEGIGTAGEVMIGPTISIGMAQHHLGFAGSVTLRPSTLMAVVHDYVLSLARHGFDRFFFLNGHGGNIATVSAAFSEIYAETSLGTAGHNRPPLRCRLQNWWACPGVQALSNELFGENEGSHATPSEISLTYFAHENRIPSVEMAPGRAPSGPIYDADDYRRRFPDGRIGSDPTLANVDAGRRLYEVAVKEIGARYQQFLNAE